MLGHTTLRSRNGHRRLEENQVQARLTYKFDWYTPPPIVAKY